MGDVVKLLTTTLSQHNVIKNVYCETVINTKIIIRIGRCVGRFIEDGRYKRECNPILEVLNNKSADVISFKK